MACTEAPRSPGDPLEDSANAPLSFLVILPPVLDGFQWEVQGGTLWRKFPAGQHPRFKEVTLGS